MLHLFICYNFSYCYDNSLLNSPAYNPLFRHDHSEIQIIFLTWSLKLRNFFDMATQTHNLLFRQSKKDEYTLKSNLSFLFDYALDEIDRCFALVLENSAGKGARKRGILK